LALFVIATGVSLVLQAAWLSEVATARLALAAKSSSPEVRLAIEKAVIRLGSATWLSAPWNGELEEAKARAGFNIAKAEPTPHLLTAALSQNRVALATSPVNPAGWARMAALAAADRAAPCGPRLCLERSFETGLMAADHDDTFKCDRIRQAIKTGLVTKVGDRRVLATLADVHEHPGIVECLRGLPSAAAR
jgi:hypothetical protein